MAAMMWLCITGVLSTLVCLSHQLPVNGYNRHKHFLDAFGNWLQQAEAAKHVSERGDPGVMKSGYPMEDPGVMKSGYPMEDPGMMKSGYPMGDPGMMKSGYPMEYMYPGNDVIPPDSDYWKDVAAQQELDHEGQAVNGELFVEADWPKQKPKLGQIGGVATNQNGDVVIFHRADRTWEQDSFENEVFKKKEAGPITKPTVVSLNRTDGSMLPTAWGENLFYLPHGLTIDKDGNHWVTDVAMHQVFKFGKNKAIPEMTLGKAFEPASNNDDLQRFCKPTDVAVASDGSFFVADGYCNSRIIKYTAEGVVVGAFGQDDASIPHSLALVEELDLICVADRENKRILCYNAGLKDDKLGYPDRAYMDKSVMGRVFAITYSPTDGLLYAVTAPSDEIPGAGFTIDMHTKDSDDSDIIAEWIPSVNGFDMPHDVDVSPDGSAVYVGEIGPNNIWKFDKTQ